MRKIYTLKTNLWNGSVIMSTLAESFLDRDLAIEARDAVIKKNEKNTSLQPYYVSCDLQESVLFESRDEVKILNE